MAKRTEQQWRDLFQQHEQSGLTAAQFCRENKLCSKYFSLRRRQLSGEQVAPPPPAFVKARLPTTPVNEKSLIILNYQHCQLQMPASVDEKWLAGLLKALA